MPRKSDQIHRKEIYLVDIIQRRIIFSETQFTQIAKDVEVHGSYLLRQIEENKARKE